VWIFECAMSFLHGSSWHAHYRDAIDVNNGRRDFAGVGTMSADGRLKLPVSGLLSTIEPVWSAIEPSPRIRRRDRSSQSSSRR
jgi:hypothetical protein